MGLLVNMRAQPNDGYRYWGTLGECEGRAGVVQVRIEEFYEERQKERQKYSDLFVLRGRCRVQWMIVCD